MAKEVVRSIPMLKGMEKEELIILHEQTGTKITGLYSREKFTCCYVWDAPNSCFEYKRMKFKLEYFSGCFMPYVVYA